MNSKNPNLSNSHSYRMSKIRGKNTKPEMIVRRYLHKKGFRYSLHRKDLPGRPDIVLSKHRAIINVNGCFWHHHNCGNYKIPINNRKFWLNKLNNNQKRDRLNNQKLKKLGWCVYNVWECQLSKKKPMHKFSKMFLQKFK